MECLQLSWGCVLSHSELSLVDQALRKLMGRLGEITRYAYSASDGIMDDPQYITLVPSHGLYITTRKYIRQMLCLFLVLFRYCVWALSGRHFVPLIFFFFCTLQGAPHHYACARGP